MHVLSGVFTGLLLVLFIGIWIWAWSKRNKESFEKMARLPLEEDQNDKPGDAHE